MYIDTKTLFANCTFAEIIGRLCVYKQNLHLFNYSNNNNNNKMFQKYEKNV